MEEACGVGRRLVECKRRTSTVATRAVAVAVADAGQRPPIVFMSQEMLSHVMPWTCIVPSRPSRCPAYWVIFNF